MLEGYTHKAWVMDLLHCQNHGIKEIQNLTFWELWFLAHITGQSEGKYPRPRKTQRFGPE